ncbi:MAG: LL-diaminopimelate aminotransferase [Dysgonamonadaceae bacterium]|jgi:LL-diaminopimelate aminotransferase|nr:LL-diaminopimelate aminotransferase [Dysgonamonadaceae bacterium]
MFQINENYQQLNESYLFSTISKKISAYAAAHPDAKIIRMGIGDVTLPLSPAVIEALHKSVDEMGAKATFRGYGPEQGYDFLREKIAGTDFQRRGINIAADEIFVSDGAKSDTGNIGDILGEDNSVAITDPVYPVYLDTNIMRIGQGDKIHFLASNAANNFLPEIPSRKIDVVYLCYPNNPTGTVMKKAELKKWVEYAREHESLILFDAAYEAFITESDVPHSIFEIEGAEICAIEFRSFSKNAGFTGLRCSYTVVPKALKAKNGKGEKISLHALWKRRQSTKYNETPYIVQRGAEAVYSPEGQKETKALVAYYMENAKTIRNGLEQKGWTVYGGINAPYIWVQCPAGTGDSWGFFDRLLNECLVVGTPGVGFGKNGEGYFRFSSFNSHENTREAVERIKNWKY